MQDRWVGGLMAVSRDSVLLHGCVRGGSGLWWVIWRA